MVLRYFLTVVASFRIEHATAETPPSRASSLGLCLPRTLVDGERRRPLGNAETKTKKKVMVDVGVDVQRQPTKNAREYRSVTT